MQPRVLRDPVPFLDTDFFSRFGFGLED